MKFCSVTISKILYPTLNNFTRRSLVAAEIAVLSYFADVKANIRILSERLIGEGLASHDEDIIAGAKIRRRSLVKFLRGRTPLSYGAHVYPDLMRSVNPAGHHMSLQVGDPKSMSSQEVAGLMYNMTKAINPIGLQPPFFSKVKLRRGVPGGRRVHLTSSVFGPDRRHTHLREEHLSHDSG